MQLSGALYWLFKEDCPFFTVSVYNLYVNIYHLLLVDPRITTL